MAVESTAAVLPDTIRRQLAMFCSTACGTSGLSSGSILDVAIASVIEGSVISLPPRVEG
jgi:hypothetical protein